MKSISVTVSDPDRVHMWTLLRITDRDSQRN